VSARRALEQGFTTLRDLETEGAGYGDVGIKQAIEKGYIPGPRLFVVTRAISTTGGYPLEDYAPESGRAQGGADRGRPGGGAQGRAASSSTTGGLAEGLHDAPLVGGRAGDARLPADADRGGAARDRGRGARLGRKVACHAYSGVGLHRALDGGCDSIEHGLDLDDAAVAQMVKQGTWYCPTMTPYYYDWEPADTPAGKRDRARAAVHGPSLQKAMKAGVKIVFGTDVGGFSWTEPIAQEFKRLAEFGMSPADAIRSATVSAAEMLGMAGEIGVIAPGAYADIVAVPGDPLPTSACSSASPS
jgi:imidazolonepropionase-like amidohydrolase